MTADHGKKYGLMLKVCLTAMVFCSFTGKLPAQEPALKDVFAGHFLVGCAFDSAQLFESNRFALPIVVKHFNSITPENSLKWENVHPSFDEYNFATADSLVLFGEKHNMFIIGHTLVWHNQTPGWVFRNQNGQFLTRDELLERMRGHIETVVGRYKGKIHGWDVVNEALEEDGTLRQSEWLKIIGEDYIEKAFEYAHQADPDAELYYNDFSLENEPKRNGAAELIRKLQAGGVKIDGVGLQGHYKIDWPTAEQLDSTIKVFGKFNLKVMITELDIDVLPYATIDFSADINLNVAQREELNPYKDGLPDSADNLLAARYSEMFDVLVNNSAVVRVTFWGVTDKDSWLNDWPVIGRSNYPLLFDRNGNPKRAYKAVVEKYLK